MASISLSNPTMKKFRYNQRLQVVCLSALLAIGALPYAGAQETAPAAPDSSDEITDDELIVLSPFTVEGGDETGYQAASTLAGTRIRTDLRDVASSISVVTKDFLDDTGATSSQDLLVYTTNTEVGGVGGNFSGNAGSSRYNEDLTLRRPQSNTRVRGLDSADNTRGYFLTEIPWDSYNTSRVDLQRGPNSILFGVGSPAGIINTTLNAAGYETGGTYQLKIDEFGSLRNSIDYNYEVIEDELSVRGAFLDERTKYRQDQAEENDQRFYGALRYNPDIGDDATLQIRANFELGKVEANRPRTLPPADAISPWFWQGVDAYGNSYLNKFTYDASQVDPNASPFSNDRFNYPWTWLQDGSMGRQFWTNVVGFYDGNGGSPSFRQVFPSDNNGIAADGTIDGGIGNLSNGRPYAITSYSNYAKNSGMPGGGFYADRSLADTSIFNFFDELIDGDNKYENQDWTAWNIALEQTFMDGRFGYELVYDVQSYEEEARVFIGASDTYKIGVDILSHFHDGTPNPNVGRAYVANSTEQANRAEDIDRDSLRLTAFAEVSGDDFFDEDSWLARIIGKHTFTGLFAEDNKEQFIRNWATSSASPQFAADNGESTNLTAHHRSFDYVVYLSDDLRSRTTANGTNLSPANIVVEAPASASVRAFDNNWANPAGIDPGDPFTYTPVNGLLPFNPAAPVVATQSENLANYVGWGDRTVSFLNADAGDQDNLTYNAQRLKNKIRSYGVVWQGEMLDGHILPVIGWRKDKVTNHAGNGDLNSDGIADLDFGYGPDSQEAEDNSISYGAVIHLPNEWTESLPGNTRLSFTLNKSENFKADAVRGDVFGNPIANPIGETQEYGVLVETLDGKLTVRATWYETEVANATLPGSNPLGQNSYFLWAVPAWGTAFTVNADRGIAGVNDGNNWAWNYAGSDDPDAPPFRDPVTQEMNAEWLAHPSTVQLQNAIDAWRQIPLEQSFFDAYGNEVALINVDAIRAGDWPNADPIWNQKFDNQPVAGGVLAAFGTPPAFTVDTVSEGWEFEIHAKPTRNWNIMVNASKTFASRAALAPTIVQAIEDMTDFLAGPAGDIRLWGGGPSNALRNQWQNNILNPYQTFKSQEGSQAPEVAPWRLNAITNYQFDEGKFKGFSVGGALRWEDSRVLGYAYDPNLGPLGALDISRPWKSDTETHLDLWFAYRKRLTDSIDWKIQLNVRNVAEDTELVPVSVNPDGTTAFSRIREGMTWQLTNTFEF